MKTSKLFLAVATTAIILSSCSVSIHKRQHGKGYFITSTKKMTSTKVEEEKSEEIELAKHKEKETTTTQVNQQTVVVASTNETPVENFVTTKITTQKTIQKDNTQLAANIATPVKTEKQQIKLDKKTLKNEIKKSKHSIAEEDTILYVILSIFIPPLAVYLQRDLGKDFWINFILTLLFWLPGVIHALLITFGKI